MPLKHQLARQLFLCLMQWMAKLIDYGNELIEKVHGCRRSAEILRADLRRVPEK